MDNLKKDHSKNKISTPGKRSSTVPKYFKDCPDGKIGYELGSGGQAEFRRFLANATGSKDVGVGSQLFDQVACTQANATERGGESLNLTLALLNELAPQNVLEGLLFTQMAGIHNLSMEMLKRAAAPGQTAEGAERVINRAVKLTRTFAAQVEALHKLRNGGQQKVTVEHVTVNAGGQAVVGNIGVRKGEGGNDDV